MTYKYHLDKSSKKFSCPNCQKKTFVKYIDAETNQYLEPHIGRCDRESKCGYHTSPKGNSPLVTLPNNYKVVLPTFHDENVIGVYGKNYTNNNFIKYLQSHFCNVDIKKAIKMYFIGTSEKWDGSTIFWQIDEKMQVHTGKVMLYNNSTGKRVKKPFPHINWMHKVLNQDNFILQQCLFGLHNLNDSLIKTIALVESEKTAIIMSIFRPDMIWMATGSKTNFKASLLKPLKGRRIMAFPDKTEYQDWNHKSSELRKLGFNIVCSQLLEHKSLEEGSDLVDFITQIKMTA